MPNLDHTELMQGYAIQGLQDWQRSADARRRDLVSRGLGQNHLAERENDILGALRQRRSTDRPKFIPMPQGRNRSHQDNGFHWPFFAAATWIRGEREVTAFDLLISYEDHNWLAFRFEPRNPNEKSHNYTHLQISKKPFNEKVSVKGIPKFISSSYPAFSLPGSDTLSLFFAMVVAVHGYSETRGIILRAFQAGGETEKARIYSLDKLLDI